MRRQDDVLPNFKITAENEELVIQFENNWLKNHPLMASELNQEIKYQKKCGWKLKVS
jgi:exopolyphosphatase/guanosine-5'-triphosphate,3'-diphosphate pyrophosphatase